MDIEAIEAVMKRIYDAWLRGEGITLTKNEVDEVQSLVTVGFEQRLFFAAESAGDYSARSFTPASFHGAAGDCVNEMERIGRQWRNDQKAKG